MNEGSGSPPLRNHRRESGEKGDILFFKRLFDRSKHFHQQSTEDRGWYETHCYLVPVSRIAPVPASLIGAGY